MVNLHWTRNKYSGRGILLEQDKIAEFNVAGRCVICGMTKIRKRYRSGALEKMSAFLARKTCGRYIGEDGEFKAGKCLRTIPCGKRWETGCEGWLKGKTYDEAFGELVSSEMKQKLSYEMKRKLATGKIDNTKPKVEKRCCVCGNITLDSPCRAKNRVVCSLKCAGSKNGRAEWVKNNYEKFAAQQKTRRQGEYKKCIFCQKEFYLYPSTRKTGKWCSRKCEVASHKIEHLCIQCKNPFQVRKSEAWKIKRCQECRRRRVSDITLSNPLKQ